MNKANMPRNRGGKAGFRRFVIGLNTGVSLLLGAALLLMMNYLSFRHYHRSDWSGSKYYSLSEKTKTMLGGLSNTVNVVVFFQPEQAIYEDVDNLLKEYEFASRLIRVERVDPDRDIGRTEELMRKYQVEEANVVVFESDGRSKYVTAGDIVEWDYTPVRMGQPPVKVGFRGEDAFSSAISSITQAKKPKVYFLQGHGERDIENFERSAGYSSIAQEIRRDNIEVATLTLGETKTIPEDCDALIVAGPTKQLADPEVSLVRDYLERQGRVMLLLDAMTECGLEPLLGEWGVRLVSDVVVDATRTLTGRELFVTQYGEHQITRKLAGVTSIFYLPRSVDPDSEKEDAGDPADKPHVISLASCSESGWAETDLTQSPMRYDFEADRPGPVSVAVAVEKGPVPGIDVHIRPTRLVIFGDSDFAANGAMTGGNTDFFLTALNWLLEREDMMGIAPKPVDQNQLIMTRAQLQGLFWIVVAALPAIIAVIGVAVWMRRRA